MPFQNHISEKDLKAYIPELSRLLWSDESDFSSQRAEAERLVLMDLADRGYKGIDVMPELVLRKNGVIITSNETGAPSAESNVSRTRFVFDVTKYTPGGSNSIQLEGSDDKTAWEIILTENITGLSKSAHIINKEFRYYRVSATVTGSSMDFKAYMVETTLDRLVSFKWLELILLDRYAEENDQYHSKMKYFKKEYDELWNRIKIWRDLNENLNSDFGETGKTSNIQMLK